MFAKFFRLIVVAVVSLFVVASLAACDPGDGSSSDSSPFVPVDCSSGQCVAVSTPAPAPTVAPQSTPDQQAVDVHKAAEGMACMFNDPIAAMLGDCSK